MSTTNTITTSTTSMTDLPGTHITKAPTAEMYQEQVEDTAVEAIGLPKYSKYGFFDRETHCYIPDTAKAHEDATRRAQTPTKRMIVDDDDEEEMNEEEEPEPTSAEDRNDLVRLVACQNVMVEYYNKWIQLMNKVTRDPNHPGFLFAHSICAAAGMMDNQQKRFFEEGNRGNVAFQHMVTNKVNLATLRGLKGQERTKMERWIVNCYRKDYNVKDSGFETAVDFCLKKYVRSEDDNKLTPKRDIKQKKVRFEEQTSSIDKISSIVKKFLESDEFKTTRDKMDVGESLIIRLV